MAFDQVCNTRHIPCCETDLKFNWKVVSDTLALMSPQHATIVPVGMSHDLPGRSILGMQGPVLRKTIDTFPLPVACIVPASTERQW